MHIPSGKEHLGHPFEVRRAGFRDIDWSRWSGVGVATVSWGLSGRKEGTGAGL